MAARRSPVLVPGFILAFSAVAGAAWSAALPVSRDDLTISGRFDLPHADNTPFKGRLVVDKVVIDAALAKQVGGKADQFKTALAEATAKSLGNFGYLAADDAKDTVPLTLTLSSRDLKINSGEDAVVVARLSLKTSDPQTDACLPDMAEGRFRAISPAKTGNGRKAAGVIAVIGFAAIGYNAGEFAGNQFMQAAEESRALNARRRAEGEAVSPGSGDAALASYAVINATRATLADALRQLSEIRSCAS